MRRYTDLVVVGLGYVGLPLALRACDAGLATVGYDIQPGVVKGLNQGRSHVSDVDDSDLAAALAAGFTATTDPAVIAAADTVVICVPTGLGPDREPDLGPVRAAAATVAANLRAGTLVVLESTSFPGTTSEVVRPILEAGSGLRTGDDFYLAFSPERIDPGNLVHGVSNTPKVVSGHTPLCAKYCAAFYDRFVDSVVLAGGTREAELAKLVENTYRFVNIALVNEVALYCDRTGIDVWDVLRCAGTKPFGFTPFRPGPGVGGHCIPVDPLYLAGRAAAEGFDFGLIEAARAVNERMPGHVVARVGALLAARGTRDLTGAEVLLLGVTYKPDVPDVRESPAVPIAAGLTELGVRVSYHDPHVPALTVAGRLLRAEPELTAALERADVTVLLQRHAGYDPAGLGARARLLFDTTGSAVPGDRVELL